MILSSSQLFGILVELDRDPPLLQLITTNLMLDGWEIFDGGADFVVREHRDVGLKVNGKRFARFELVDRDEIEANGQRYLFKDFVRFRK